MEAADSRVRIILRLAGCVGGDVRARLGNDLATPSSRVIKPTSFRGGGFLVLLVGHMVLSRMILRPPPSHISILHERANFCVVAKPAGIMVHRNKFSRKDESGIALLQLVRDQVGKQVFPVHRLDGGTSGCLIFAYDSATCAMLQAAMQSPTARKVYLAHVRGDASWVQQHTVSRPIKDSEGTSRDSETFFDCLAACDDALPERSSLMRCTPKTGRWHQLRKHLNGLSHPILGDAKHGDSRVNRWWRSELGFQHLGLHCHEMHLQLPYGDPLSVTCPVRPDLIDVWRQLVCITTEGTQTARIRPCQSRYAQTP